MLWSARLPFIFASKVQLAMPVARVWVVGHRYKVGGTQVMVSSHGLREIYGAQQ